MEWDKVPGTGILQLELGNKHIAVNTNHTTIINPISDRVKALLEGYLSEDMGRWVSLITSPLKRTDSINSFLDYDLLFEVLPLLGDTIAIKMLESGLWFISGSESEVLIAPKIVYNGKCLYLRPSCDNCPLFHSCVSEKHFIHKEGGV